MVVSEKHKEGEGCGDIAIPGKSRISTCCRKTGQTKEGVVKYVHDTIPCYEEYSLLAQEKNGLGRRAVAAFPNRNLVDRLVRWGVYRPPEKQRPNHTAASGKMLAAQKKTQQIAAKVLGVLNINAWETAEKGEKQTWVGNEELWELSDPNEPTYRAGTGRGGVLFARGKYLPAGCLPRDMDMDMDIDGGYPNVSPVVVSAATKLVGHHALALELCAMEPKSTPRSEKYNINTLTKETWPSCATNASKTSRCETGGPGISDGITGT